MAAPAFHSGPPPQLASWANVGLDWGPANDIPTLQSRIRELLERDISLIKVIQVMLVRWTLPCKRRPLRMWEFNPEGPRTIQHFFGMMLEGMYRLFFGSRVKCPDTTEDAGLSCNLPDTQVSNPAAEHPVHVYHNIILKTIRGQDWLSKAEMIRCPALLPKGSPNPALTRMLRRVLNQVPSGKDEGKSREAENELHTLYIQTRRINVSIKEDNWGGESKVSSPRGKKRAASEDLEMEVPKEGKKTSPGGPAPEGVLIAQRPQTGQPSTEL